MRIDKKKKKKEIVLKIIVTFGLVKILIEVTTMSNKTKDISSGRGNTTLLVQYTGRYGEQTDASASSRYQTTTESRRLISIYLCTGTVQTGTESDR